VVVVVVGAGAPWSHIVDTLKTFFIRYFFACYELAFRPSDFKSYYARARCPNFSPDIPFQIVAKSSKIHP
jgi:hypothetical protein